MRTVIVGLVSAAGVSADYPPPNLKSSAGYASASPHYGSYPAENTDSHLHSKDHFEQYWKNLELCDAEFDLSTCLLDSHDEHDFFREERIAECTLDFVNDFCGALVSNKSRIDNGHVLVDDVNCQTTVFANSFLIYQQLITNLNSIIGVTPSLERWTVANIALAIQVTRNNADCVINSFFNFLNQCASSNYISDKDMQCLEDYLFDEKCEFATDDVDNWNIPNIVRRYGMYGYEEMIENLKQSYGTTELSQVIPELQRILQDSHSEKAQGLHYMETEYDNNLQLASVNTCPNKYKSMNFEFESTGFEGIAVDEVAFHFPIEQEITFKKTGSEDIMAELDPLYNEEKSLDNCASWFEFTKDHYNQVVNGVGEDTVHLSSRCFAIKGYEIMFLESGRSVPLIYDKISNNDQCFNVKWKEAQSCSSHLSEWRMTVSCCTSYADYYEANTPSPATDYYNPSPNTAPFSYRPNTLLSEGNNVPAYPPGSMLNHNNHYQSHPHPPQYPIDNGNYYHSPIAVRKVDPRDLIFDKTVASLNSAGKLIPLDLKVHYEPTNVIDEMDRALDGLFANCAFTFPNSGKFEQLYNDHCAKVEYHAEQKENDEDLKNNAVFLLSASDDDTLRGFTPATTDLDDTVKEKDFEFVLDNYDYYIGDDESTTDVCNKLNIDLNFNAIIPLVSGRCYPQTCILSQISSCMEQPDAQYTYEPPSIPDYKGHIGNTYYAAPHVNQPQNHGGYY
jgi:hypothetical protein